MCSSLKCIMPDKSWLSNMAYTLLDVVRVLAARQIWCTDPVRVVTSLSPAHGPDTLLVSDNTSTHKTRCTSQVRTLAFVHQTDNLLADAEPRGAVAATNACKALVTISEEASAFLAIL
eukprot:IDg2477t1